VGGAEGGGRLLEFCLRNERRSAGAGQIPHTNKYQFGNLLHFLGKSTDICLKSVMFITTGKFRTLDVVASIPVCYAGRLCLECEEGHWFYVKRYYIREGTQLVYSY
jgi:hypothetical protein